MKKYIYAGVLLGSIVLTGCSENKESEEKAQINEEKATGHAVDAESLLDKEKVVSVTPLELTQEQKVNYHKKYTEIVNTINAKEDTIYTLEVVPINEFNPEDWIEIELFEKLSEDRANAKVVVLENNDRYNPNSVPKTVELHMGSNVTTIIFTGSFETQLNSNTPDGRQLFSKANSISSVGEVSDESWTQIGYDSTLSDDGVSYNIIVGGQYSQSGIISSHNIELEFNCDIYGGIS